MGSKEVLTLQFGHYANFIGTHWWNVQEQGFDYNNHSSVSEINNDVLYREGLTEKGEVTFTPRLLLVDLKGSLKSLPERGDLYNPVGFDSKECVGWDPNLVEVKEKPKSIKNRFQEDLQDPQESGNVCDKSYKLEEDVSVWSDFLYSRFHPRTVNLVNEYQHCNEDTPFNVYSLGVSLWKTRQFEDEFCDKIRNYAEECDSFQGFQVLTDCANAFSGLSSACLEYLQDDYPRKSVLVFPVIPSYFEDNDYKTAEEKNNSIINDSLRVLNLAFGFNQFSTHSSLFVPLCAGVTGWRQPGAKRDFYHTVYDQKLPYHSSAILAAALETFTMKYRLKSSDCSMIDLCVDLSRDGRRAAAASLCLPFSFNVDADLLGCLDNWQGPLSQSITPNCKLGTDKLLQHIVLRGISEDKLKGPNQTAKLRDTPAYKCHSITDMLNLYLSYSTSATTSNVTVVSKPLCVKTPYPNIFDKSIDQDGYVSATPRPEQVNVKSVPVLAGLHNGAGVGDMLESLHTEARRIRFGKLDQFTSGCVEKDEFEECLDNLFTFRENYVDNYYL